MRIQHTTLSPELGNASQSPPLLPTVPTVLISTPVLASEFSPTLYCEASIRVSSTKDLVAAGHFACLLLFVLTAHTSYSPHCGDETLDKSNLSELWGLTVRSIMEVRAA